MSRALGRGLEVLGHRLRNLVARGIVQLIDDGRRLQIVQLSVLKGEVRSALERVQNYGFTSVPKVGSEAVVLFPGGSRDHGLVVAIDDRRVRLKSLGPGQVAVYDSAGSKIVLDDAGDVDVTAPGDITVTATGAVNVTGGTVVISGDTEIEGRGFLEHTHSGVQSGGDNSGGVV